MRVNNQSDRRPVSTRRAAMQQRAMLLACGFAATLLGLPVEAALVIPSNPLQSGTSVAPNIMFILDDSTSMGLDFMPSTSTGACDIETINLPSSMSSTARRDISCKAHTTNTLYYDPATVYQPWATATMGGRLANASYIAASNHDYLLTTPTDLSTSHQTFYVHRSDAINNKANYYRYQIRSGTGGRVVRAEWANTSTSPGDVTDVMSVAGLAAARNTWVNGTTGNAAPANIAAGSPASFNVPANVTSMTVEISGSDANADVYLRRGSLPTTSNNSCSGAINSTSNEVCTIASPSSGTWYVGVRAPNSATADAFSAVTLKVSYTAATESTLGCATTASGFDWRNCVRQGPTSRDDVAEKQNFANWYAYHRTRMKAAKAGAGDAFNVLGNNLRIGFTNIHDDTGSKLNIPVNTNAGRFEGQNRVDWFAKLHAENVASTSYTPLRTGLAAVGEYYRSPASDGPWGPGVVADQLGCRQNFAILTTDGYWNKQDEETVAGYVSGNHDGTDGPNGYTAQAPYSDAYTDTLADVAMYYWKTDLRTDKTNIVVPSLTNPATWQHMVTFGISIGLKGTVSPDAPGNWPNPDPGTGTGNQYGIDDLLHAAVNGRGTFAVANKADDFTTALRAALSKILGDVGSGSNVSLSSTGIQNDTRAFVAKYKPGEWYGEMEAYPVTAGGVQGPATWKASTTVPTAMRTDVYTLGAGNGAVVAPFPTTAQEDVLTPAVASYIKGNRAGETGTTPIYRTRTHLLGDIVNSSPAYVREVVGGATVETVYIGANDGMLHAFNADGGAELFTYVPNLIDMGALKNLSIREDFAHQYFVDGPIVVSNRRQTPGANHLVGTLGRGGKGVYGLDVSTPGNFSGTGKAWEYNGAGIAADIADMGNVLGKPLIVKLNTGDMAAIVGNGINSTNEHAVLFVLNLTTGVLEKKIDTFQTGEPLNNGLSAPTALDIDGNGTVDYVYAGDLNGNVWKFDLSSSTKASWGVAGTADTPIFTAVDGLGNRQPITGGVTVAFNPYTYHPWVFFGTGRYLTDGDKTDKSIQTWYGMVDDGTAITGRGQLKERDIVAIDAAKTKRAFEKAGANDMVGKRGWFIDLLNPSNTAEGERMVGNQVVVGGTTLLASSIIPESSDCNPTGRGYVNAVDIYTGASVSAPFFDSNGDGYITEADVLTAGSGENATEIPVGSMDLGVGMPTDPTVLDNLVIVGGSKGTTGSVKIARLIQDARISWREILKD